MKPGDLGLYEMSREHHSCAATMLGAAWPFEPERLKGDTVCLVVARRETWKVKLVVTPDRIGWFLCEHLAHHAMVRP